MSFVSVTFEVRLGTLPAMFVQRIHRIEHFSRKERRAYEGNVIDFERNSRKSFPVEIDEPKPYLFSLDRCVNRNTVSQASVSLGPERVTELTMRELSSLFAAPESFFTAA